MAVTGMGGGGGGGLGTVEAALVLAIDRFTQAIAMVEQSNADLAGGFSKMETAGLDPFVPGIAASIAGVATSWAAFLNSLVHEETLVLGQLKVILQNHQQYQGVLNRQVSTFHS